MTKQDQIQKEITDKILDFFKSEKGGYLDVGMRVGKCKITIDVLKTSSLHHVPTVLIAYPDNKIKQSWVDEFVKWGYNSITVLFTNFSSLAKYKDARPDFFIIDEFHSASALERDYCHQIMTNYVNTKTLALSGTISKDTKYVWGLKEIAKYTTLEGIEDEILADYQITVHYVNLDTKVKTPNKKNKLLTEKQRYDNFSYVIKKFKNEGKETMHLLLSRNRLSTGSLGKLNYVRKLLLTILNKRVIVFAGLTETADKIGIPSYHSKSEESANFQKFQNGEIRHLALASMGKMGVSFNKLDTVIIMNATHNAADTAQMLNRAIKLDYIGKVADLHIICLNEEAEKEKIKNSLALLDKTKINYIYAK